MLLKSLTHLPQNSNLNHQILRVKALALVPSSLHVQNPVFDRSHLLKIAVKKYASINDLLLGWQASIDFFFQLSLEVWMTAEPHVNAVSIDFFVSLVQDHFNDLVRLQTSSFTGKQRNIP